MTRLSAESSHVRSIPFGGWYGVTAVVTVSYFVLPDSAVPFGLPVWSLACATGALWRSARNPHQLVSWLMGLALLHSAVGEMLFTWFEVTGNDPFPSYADVFYLAAYPLLAVGFVLLARQSAPRGDKASLIDASIVAVAASALAWVVIGAPYVSEGGSALAVGVSLAYPLGDLLVLGFLCRLLLTPALRSRSIRVLAAATTAMLVADSGFLVLDLAGTYRPGNIIDAGWLLFYGLTTAALGRNMIPASGAARSADAVVDMSAARLALLSAAVLLAPATLIAEGIRHGTGNVLAIGLITAILFLLVLARMHGLVREVQEQAADLARVSDTDALTGVPNRRAWERELARAVANAERSGTRLAIAMVDIDHFKNVNDTRGHAGGDRLLIRAAAGWQATLRRGDFLARHGGEEFGVLLPGADEAAAMEAAERIRTACPEGQTCSLGVTVLDRGEDVEAALERVDTALYDAKRAGRNRSILLTAPCAASSAVG